MAPEVARGDWYGAPADVRLKSRAGSDDDAVFEYTFVALSPAMREVERRVRARARLIGGRDAFVLVAGATQARWRAAEPNVARCTASFAAKPAPEFSAEMQAYRNRKAK